MENTTQKAKDKAYEIATGHYLTETFTAKEFDSIAITEYITETYEYDDPDNIRASIEELAETMEYALIEALNTEN